MGSDARLVDVVHGYQRPVLPRRRRPGRSRRDTALVAPPGIGLLRQGHAVARRAGRRPGIRHRLLQVHDHRKGGLLMAVMADLARMPTSRKVLLFTIVGMLIGLVYSKTLREVGIRARSAMT